MNRHRLLTLAALAVVLLGAGIWINAHRDNRQADLGGGKVFADLTPALGEISEIRLSRGDGSRATLRKGADGWSVVERKFPADPGRVRELVLGMVDMKVVESKTSDPANYGKLGLETPDTPAATGTLVEVIAGAKTWSLIVGKNAEGRAVYVRKPDAAASALVEPAITVDPDQKRWIDRQLLDVPGASVQAISVRPADGPAYLLSRDERGAAGLTLSPVPRGRKPASSMSINGQADTLTAFHFDDLRAAPASQPSAVDRATFRCFDGQVFEFTGHKDGDKAYVSVSASRDPGLAQQFEQPAAPAQDTAPDAGTGTDAAPAAAAAPGAPEKPAKPPDMSVERVAARSRGVEFEIPLYKYESLFKPRDELLESRPEPAARPKK